VNDIIHRWLKCTLPCDTATLRPNLSDDAWKNMYTRIVSLECCRTAQTQNFTNSRNCEYRELRGDAKTICRRTRRGGRRDNALTTTTTVDSRRFPFRLTNRKYRSHSCSRWSSSRVHSYVVYAVVSCSSYRAFWLAFVISVSFTNRDQSRSTVKFPKPGRAQLLYATRQSRTA